MHFLCLGVGDAFSNLWYSSCLLIEHDGFRLLLDCPHPIRKILREAGLANEKKLKLDLDSVDAVLLTHLHADHASGLEGLAFYNRIVLGRPAKLLAHPDVIADLWAPHLAITLGSGLDPANPPTLARFFDLTELSESHPVACGPFQILCRRTLHPIPTFAMRVEAGGRLLGLSADTAFDPSLIDWLAPAHLIVHETNHPPHTPYADLAALSADLKSKMRLIHYPDDFDLDACVIEPLRPGRVYQV